MLVVCELDSLSRFLLVLVLHIPKFSFTRFDVSVNFFRFINRVWWINAYVQFPEVYVSGAGLSFAVT